MAKMTAPVRAKLDSYDLLCKESKGWLYSLHQLKKLIVTCEARGETTVSTQSIREAMGWVLGSDYRTGSSGNSTGSFGTSSGGGDD